MSYDLTLKDPVTHETLHVPPHVMHGANIPCEMINGCLVPTATAEAYLNITYNYSHYYYEAFPVPKTPDQAEQHKLDVSRFGICPTEGGLRSLEGVTGANAILFLKEMISRIEQRYKKPDGSWVLSSRENPYIIDRRTGERVEEIALVNVFYEGIKIGLSQKEMDQIIKERYERKKETIMIDEGSKGKDYWSATAVNAIRPLYQLIAFSNLRPDGVWSVD